jgi:hypothetical protein
VNSGSSRMPMFVFTLGTLVALALIVLGMMQGPAFG